MEHRLLKYFKYSHLPEHLQKYSKTFYEVANAMIKTSGVNDQAELTAGLRKLLEAKDCFIRSMR